MKIPPDYKITPEILKLIAKIESLRLFFQSFPIKSELKNKIQRISILKSSLYSARIEGNPLTLNDVKNPVKISDRQKKLEVFNILDTVRLMDKEIHSGKKLDEELFLKLHLIVMNDLSSDAGNFRSEPSAIFNQAGMAVYITPLPSKIKELITQLLDFTNSPSDYPIIQAVLAHLIFEKIHPYIDGNGRVGRLFIWAILKAKNHDFPIAIPIEEYIDQNRDRYYLHLDRGLKETEEYIQFMLEAFVDQAEKIKAELVRESQKEEEIILPPRQEEILAIIKDHINVTLDFIKRRFYKVPSRTLRYDLKKLSEKGMIVKVGKTRGSFYRVRN